MFQLSPPAKLNSCDIIKRSFSSHDPPQIRLVFTGTFNLRHTESLNVKTGVVYFGVCVQSELMCSHASTPAKHPEYNLFHRFMQSCIKTILQSRNMLFHFIRIFTSGPTKSSLMSLFLLLEWKDSGRHKITSDRIQSGSERWCHPIQRAQFLPVHTYKKNKKNETWLSEYLHNGRSFPNCPFSVTLKCFWHVNERQKCREKAENYSSDQAFEVFLNMLNCFGSIFQLRATNTAAAHSRS